MRPLVLLGIVLVAFGIGALAYQGFVLYTADLPAASGPFAIDVQRPHTIFLHPLVGVAAIVGGAAMLLAGSRERAM